MACSQITLTPCKWSDDISAGFLVAYDGDASMLENTRMGVDSKICQLYKACVDGEVMGHAVCRIDSFMSGHRDLVIVIAYGKYKNKPLSGLFMPIFEEIAKQHECNGIRVHSARKGAERLYKRIGFEVSEIVFYKELK